MAKRGVPLALCFVMGVLMAVQFFVPHPLSRYVYENVLDWMQIVSVFALAVGVIGLGRIHWRRVVVRRAGWRYSIATLAGLAVMGILGVVGGIEQGTPYAWLFRYVQAPMQSTMMSLLAFFVVSAAYRGFRVRTREAGILLAAAMVVMLGRVPIGEAIHRAIPIASNWVLNVPNTAAMRGITIGIGLGAISTSLRIIFGVERSYLGVE
ncbi:hypothetical protein AMJ39_01970 [candidate division TA06 bacterium DG_24]|jgi:hypothetical protein|uniref:Uncharacterized protein n=3 Tax=Bacteria division TA06 TaxID=1156500 RepID=A0A0S8JPW8_UNCT6|nr:MAG: hypothetical protein AMJ39_01970 [candidate division TA06 bacterium DG_24]KPK69486.1 MAG: hypothetical protein AMJ82_05440 [candidate division TA06 bacterium SM23_40]KPL10813.1 MAG: hypothetical protein AMJ71_01800 [candidate division TA06 bacterium SM1_40]